MQDMREIARTSYHGLMERRPPPPPEDGFKLPEDKTSLSTSAKALSVLSMFHRRSQDPKARITKVIDSRTRLIGEADEAGKVLSIDCFAGKAVRTL